MKVYVLWIENDDEDDLSDRCKVIKVVESEDYACYWCSDYNVEHAGHSSAYYDEFYVEERQ